MDVCLLSPAGDSLLPRKRTAAPAPCLKAVAPSRDGGVVAVEGLCPWSWLAAPWADAGRPCVLGPARSMPAMPGGQANNDKSAAPQLAAWLRGGRLPQASVAPAARRAPRALRRRRPHLRRPRAALLAPGHQPPSPDNLPESGKQRASQAKRAGVAARLAAAAGPKTIAVALARLPSEDARRKDLQLALLNTAKPHAAHPLALRPTVPGIGPLLSLGLR
jgi:hypothetical protein